MLPGMDARVLGRAASPTLRAYRIHVKRLFEALGLTS